MILDKLFIQLNNARQAISAALNIANLESEVREAIIALEDKDWGKPGSIEEKQLDALYSIQDTLVTIDRELDSWKLELINCQVILSPTK